MSAVSDSIERFIVELLSEANNVELQRNELAQAFGCAPSQINYVLSTAFPEHGYIITSKRGGGGHHHCPDRADRGRPSAPARHRRDRRGPFPEPGKGDRLPAARGRRGFRPGSRPAPFGSRRQPFDPRRPAGSSQAETLQKMLMDLIRATPGE